MVIGSPTALADLGKRLLAAAQSPPVSPVQNWPAVAATPDVEGPFLGDPNFKLSFHVTAAGELPTSLKLRRRGLSPPWFLVIATFTVVGVLVTLGWILSLVL